MTRSGWFAASLVTLCMLGPQAALAKDDLVIGVAQSPSSLHAYIDAGGIKGYVRAAADHEL